MQTDPIGYDDQMNLYAYVGNDPLNFIDPTGEFKVNLAIEGQLVAGYGARVGVGLSVDFSTAEISVSAKGGVRSGASAGLSASATVSKSEKLGNSAGISASANADVGVLVGSADIDLAAGSVSTNTDGVQNKSGGLNVKPGIGMSDSAGGRGVAIQPKIGVSAGVDSTVSGTLSITDTAAAAGQMLNQAETRVREHFTCRGSQSSGC